MPPKSVEASSHLNHGHRTRLRERLLKSGVDALAPDELIELILFLSISRGDVKPLAKVLWQRYGGFEALCQRPVEELKDIPGLGEHSIATLKTIYGLALNLLKPSVLQKPLLNIEKNLIPYVRLRMTPFEKEQCFVFYLNHQHQVIYEEHHQKGTTHEVVVYPREIMKIALNVSAHGVVLCHNHPWGDARPSEEDDALTERLRHMCQMLEFELVDHFIITPDSFYSYRASRWEREGLR